MTEIKSKYKVGKQKNGLPHFGEVHLILDLTENKKLEIVEKYSGKGFYSQGYEEVIPEKGYDDWKQGIKHGITYAYSKLKNTNGLKVTIEQASGLTTDTNSIILGFVASRAVLNELENIESESELIQLEELVYSSWNYELDSLPNFVELTIDGKKLPIKRYKINGGNSPKTKDSNTHKFWSKLKRMWS